VVVDHVVLVRLGIFVMNWLSVILIFILVSVTIVATFWYSIIQFSRFRRKVRRTITEVESTLKTNVGALKRDTEEFHTLLVKAEKKRELTKEEQTILKKFKKRLEITEKEIDKKLEQIG
jgi:biopolymer transport protein ExbB/TolQ